MPSHLVFMKLQFYDLTYSENSFGSTYMGTVLAVIVW